jgi:signal transduction histidine kinase
LVNKNKIIFAILLLIFVVLSISSIFNHYKHKEYIETKNQQSFLTLQNMIDGKIIFFRKHFNARLKQFLKGNKAFQDALINDDFKTIELQMQSLFKQLKKENRYTKILHLVKPDNISWYRAHKPNKHGDDLTLFRPVLVHVNQYKNSKYGFEAGLHAMAYRVDIPIFYNGKYYGVLEYGADSNLFTSDFTIVSDHIQSATLLSIPTVTKFSLNNKQIIKKSLGESAAFKLYDNDEFFKGIKVENLEKGELFQKKDKIFEPFLYDLMSFDGMVTGKIVIAKDVTADMLRNKSMITLSILNQIILIVIIFLIVWYAFRYYENKILQLTEHEKQNERIIAQQSKMASMGEMIGNIAHQWRQPLSTISTIASGINVQKEYGIFDESTLTESMEKVIQQTEYMTQTIEDFREFFKTDKEKIKFELTAALEQDVRLIEASLKSHDIDVEFNFTKQVFVYGLQNELTQALLNVLSNSKDQLSSFPKERKKLIRLTINEDRKNIHISILDNGGGIDEKIIEKIFDPYFTTKHQAQGTGIGLYMTYEIIVRHFNGSIKFSNIEETIDGETFECALFDIALPKSEDEL